MALFQFSENVRNYLGIAPVVRISAVVRQRTDALRNLSYLVAVADCRRVVGHAPNIPHRSDQRGRPNEDILQVHGARARFATGSHHVLKAHDEIFPVDKVEFGVQHTDNARASRSDIPAPWNSSGSFQGVAHVARTSARAVRALSSCPSCIPGWQVLLSRYPATFIANCRKAIDLSNSLVTGWLESGMMKGEPKPADMAKIVVEWLGNPERQKTHDRHVSADALRAHGVKVVDLERASGTSEAKKDQAVQDKILAVHHACIHPLAATPAVIENHDGGAFIVTAQTGHAAVPVPIVGP